MVRMETLAGEHAEPIEPPVGDAVRVDLQPPEQLEIDAALAAIEAAAGVLQKVDIGVLGQVGLLTLTRQVARASALVDSVRSRVVDRVDVTDSSRRDGLATRTWLARNAQMSGRSAGREVKRAKVLRQLPLVAAAFESGELSADQVDAFVAVFNERTATGFAENETLLVDLARSSTCGELARVLRGWADHVDTDGAEPDPGHLDRGLSLNQGFDGRWVGNFTFGSGDGALVGAAINDRVEALFRSDQRDGIERSATQRRADALRDLVLGEAKPRVTINVVVSAADVDAGLYGSRLVGAPSTATADAGGFVTAADTLRLAADAAIRAVVVDPAGGAVLHYGRSRRLASGPQNVSLAIETDGVCGFVGCDHSIDIAHHIVEWDDGGPTDLPLLVALCHDHHRLIHSGGWRVRKDADGSLSWRRPDGTWLDPSPGWNPGEQDTVDDGAVEQGNVGDEGVQFADELRIRQRFQSLLHERLHRDRVGRERYDAECRARATRHAERVFAPL